MRKSLLEEPLGYDLCQSKLLLSKRTFGEFMQTIACDYSPVRYLWQLKMQITFPDRLTGTQCRLPSKIAWPGAGLPTHDHLTRCKHPSLWITALTTNALNCLAYLLNLNLISTNLVYEWEYLRSRRSLPLVRPGSFHSKLECPANPVCLADVHVFLPSRTPAASHAFNLAVQLYQHSKDIQIVVRTFMQRAREKLLMSDAAAPISPSINLKVRHGFWGLWAQPQEPAAAIVLVMASLLVAQLAVSYTSLWQNSSAALR